MKKLFVVLFCIAVTISFAACNDAKTADSSGRTDVIVAMGTGSEPAYGFDPIYGWGSSEHVHEPLIQSTLINTDQDMNFVNDLATEYHSSDDGLIWTFQIRDDVKFTNGDPLTAKDVAFTYNKILSTESTEADLSMLKEARATGDYTIEFELNQPYNAFLYTVAVTGIVPEGAYGEGYAENPIGSGRYLLEEWDKGQQAIFVANPDYYGDAPKIDKVVVLFMEEDAALAAVKSGEADIAYTSAVYSDVEVDGYQLLSFDTVDSRGISLPTVASGGTRMDGENEYALGNDVTSDLAIRQAMNYAVDRDAMVKNVLNGYGQAAYSVCDGMPWAADLAFDRDIDKAKQILSDGGWADSDDDGIVEKDDLKAAFDLYYPASDSVRQGLATEFANEMKEIGIEVTIHGESWDNIYTHEYSDPVLWGWGSNSPAEPYTLNYSTSPSNFASYQNADLDKTLDEAMSSLELNTSYQKFKEAAQYTSVNGDATWVWLTNIDHLYFAKDGLNVASQKLHPHGHGWSLLNNVDEWTWQ